MDRRQVEEGNVAENAYTEIKRAKGSPVGVPSSRMEHVVGNFHT